MKRSRRDLRGGARTSLLFCWLAFAAGCVQIESQRDATRLPTRLTPDSVMAPVAGDGSTEIRGLGSTPPDLLRRAFILLKTHRSAEALGVLNRVLYSTTPPSPDTEALALYLRGVAFRVAGDRPRALEDCRRARSLAAHADLVARCDAEITALQPAVAAAPAVASAGAVPFLPRRDWNADRPSYRKLDPMGSIHRLTIHHSANLSHRTDVRAVANQILGIQRYHMGQENQWGDIGYHFLIDPAGRVWEGRPLQYQGAHAGGANNEHNIGICLLGHFVGGSLGQQPTPNQVQSMEHLVDWLRSSFAIGRGGILTHKELRADTTCPGERLQAIVDRMRHRQVAMAPGGHEPLAGGSR